MTTFEGDIQREFPPIANISLSHENTFIHDF